MSDATLRIGELARRSGVSADLLRAWERRYGLLTPARTSGGYRLYDADDEARVRSMRAHLAQGLSAAQMPYPVKAAGQLFSVLRCGLLRVTAGCHPRVSLSS